MNNYSNNLKNLIYYNPDEEAEKIRLTDLHFAREDGFELGISQGKKEKSIDIAKKLQKKGMSLEEISEITRLTKEEIKNLHN